MFFGSFRLAFNIGFDYERTICWDGRPRSITKMYWAEYEFQVSLGFNTKFFHPEAGFARFLGIFLSSFLLISG